MRALPAVIWTCLLASLQACGGGDWSVGHGCVDSSECNSGLCYSNQCLAPDADLDHDGLTNAIEHRLHSHPLLADTDGDGKPDGVEVGADPDHPLDADGDGQPDVIESLRADADGDCLPDELDAHGTPATSLELATLACAHLGVCQGHAQAVVATCAKAILTCGYAQVPGWHAVEQCDGLDDDCDGQIDEGHAFQGKSVGQACTGTGRCGEGVVECVNGEAACSSNPGGSASFARTETCDGTDDDCDGHTDEGFALGGLPVGSPCLGAGECGLGVVMCAGGVAACSSDPGNPGSGVKPEICNGKDDDCDGLTDEGIALGGLPLGAVCVAPGACGPGQVVCGAQGEAVCSSAPGSPGSAAMPELCNNLDDNCNGLTDEGFDVNGVGLGGACPAKGVCGPGVVACGNQGTATCSTWGDGPASEAKPEVCNGLDDDCNGQTDESFHWNGLDLGAPCEGVGSCGAGVVECSQEATAATCSTHPDGSGSQAKAEVCNGADDDCDGQTDEGVLPPAVVTCTTFGVCLTATPVPACSQGQWICTFASAPGFQATETTCDGQDNDCDGQTDEGLAHVWTGPVPAGDGRPMARTEAALCEGNAGLLAAGGVLSALGPQPSVLSGELWRLDLGTGLWKRLANDPGLRRRRAGAVYLPAGQVASGARLWLLGGLDAQDKPAEALAFDFLTGKTEPLALATPPEPRLDPTLVLVPKAIGPWQLWMLAGDPAGGPVAQHASLATLDWSADASQPPASTGHIAACSTPDGTLRAMGADAQGPWFQARNTDGMWQALTMPTAVTLTTARLVCDAAPGEVWLVGAQTLDGKPLAVQRFLVATGTWLTAADATWPGLLAPAVAGLPGGGLGLALGLGADGQPQDHAFVGLPGAWTQVDAAPEPVVGARWILLGGEPYRLGGATLRGKTVDFAVPAWRLHQGVWQALPLPPGQTGRAFPALAIEAGETGVLLWSGLGKATPAATLLGTETQSGAAGGLRLDAKLGTWSVLTAPVLAGLPQLQADSAVASATQVGVTWAFSAGTPTGTAALWRIEPAVQSQKLLWQSVDAPGPAFRAGSSLLHDPAANRLILGVIDGATVEVWTYALGGPAGWQLVAQEPVSPGGRVALLGGAGLQTPLVLMTWPPGGPKSVVRTLHLLPTPTLEPVAVEPPPWWGPVAGVWQPDLARVLVAGRLDAEGVPRAGLDQWLLICP